MSFDWPLTATSTKKASAENHNPPNTPAGLVGRFRSATTQAPSPPDRRPTKLSRHRVDWATTAAGQWALTPQRAPRNARATARRPESIVTERQGVVSAQPSIADKPNGINREKHRCGEAIIRRLGIEHVGRANAHLEGSKPLDTYRSWHSAPHIVRTSIPRHLCRVTYTRTFLN